MFEFNINSLDHLSALFFGGTLKYKVQEPILKDSEFETFKSGLKKGQIKLQWVEKEIKYTGLVDPKKASKPLKKQGFYSTDDETLNKIISGPFDRQAQQLAQTLLDIRGLEKQLSTYYIATQELTYDKDSCVHSQFNHTATDTGRLSCKAPNIQNQANNECLQHFKSRYE